MGFLDAFCGKNPQIDQIFQFSKSRRFSTFLDVFLDVSRRFSTFLDVFLDVSRRFSTFSRRFFSTFSRHLWQIASFVIFCSIFFSGLYFVFFLLLFVFRGSILVFFALFLSFGALFLFFSALFLFFCSICVFLSPDSTCLVRFCVFYILSRENCLLFFVFGVAMHSLYFYHADSLNFSHCTRATQEKTTHSFDFSHCTRKCQEKRLQLSKKFTSNKAQTVNSSDFRQNWSTQQRYVMLKTETKENTQMSNPKFHQ